MNCIITVSKGIQDDDVIRIELEGKDLSVNDFESPGFLSAKDIKKILLQREFIADEDEWRFVFSNVKSGKDIQYSDRLLATNGEDHYPARKLLVNDGQKGKFENLIIITNVKRKSKPDLIGFATDYFNNGDIKVRCRLRDYMKGDKEANKGKFQPLMLSDVISTSIINIGYEFVCVCCEGSIIEFPVESFGTVGMNLKAKVNNEIIYDCCFHWDSYNHDMVGRSSVNCMAVYENGKKTVRNITVKKLSGDSSILPGTGMR
jgi:hypothetical protein